MRYILATCILLTVSASAGRAETVTTQPAISEAQELRAEIKALQGENDRLRAKLEALPGGKEAIAAATATSNVPDPNEPPLAGLEALFENFPRDQMPGPDDQGNGLRYSLLQKWLKEKGSGRRISLRARFVDASGISGGYFMVHIVSGLVGKGGHAFQATLTMSEVDASEALRFHRGSPIKVTARIKSIDATRMQDGQYAIQMDLDQPTLSSDDVKPRAGAR